jgi:hypothetical protein
LKEILDIVPYLVTLPKFQYELLLYDSFEVSLEAEDPAAEAATNDNDDADVVEISTRVISNNVYVAACSDCIEFVENEYMVFRARNPDMVGE